MTDADAKEDVDLEALWEESIPCIVKDCQADVLWRVTFLCCGWYGLTCQPHKVRADRIWRSLEAQGRPLRCGECNTVIPVSRIKWSEA